MYPNDKQSFETLKKELKNIYDRRNHIAHQDDREHETLMKHPISKEEVEQVRDYLMSVIKMMIKLAKER